MNEEILKKGLAQMAAGLGMVVEGLRTLSEGTDAGDSGSKKTSTSRKGPAAADGKASSASKKPSTKKAEKPEPEPEESAEDADDPFGLSDDDGEAAPEEETFTPGDVRARMAEVLEHQNGGKDKLMEIIEPYGKKFGEIEESDYPKFMAALQAVLEED